MGKFKPVRAKKPMAPQRANAIGCIVLIALGILLMFAVVYYTVAGGSR